MRKSHKQQLMDKYPKYSKEIKSEWEHLEKYDEPMSQIDRYYDVEHWLTKYIIKDN